MTPSEHLMQLAEEKANSPENRRELLALVLDRATAAEVKRINQEIGRCATYQANYNREWRRVSPDYTNLLREYVRLKLQLHVWKKHMFYYDASLTHEEIQACLDKCATLRAEIDDARQKAYNSAWGETDRTTPPPPAVMCDMPNCKRGAKYLAGSVNGARGYTEQNLCKPHYFGYTPTFNAKYDQVTKEPAALYGPSVPAAIYGSDVPKPEPEVESIKDPEVCMEDTHCEWCDREATCVFEDSVFCYEHFLKAEELAKQEQEAVKKHPGPKPTFPESNAWDVGECFSQKAYMDNLYGPQAAGRVVRTETSSRSLITASKVRWDKNPL